MPFTIEATVSESSTTRVFRAFDETLHRRVLLKVLHRHLAHDEQLRERFVREARACAALRSEHIVQVYDLTEVEGAPAIVMEFVDGRSLKELIEEGSERTFALASKTALHVLRGLSVAHAQGIIHRDIKPGNIMVATNGTIKVSDFGLARLAVSSTMTTEGILVGTPAYLAPEQIRGEQPDARADLFSLGATVIEVLCGERLFEGTTYAECLNKVSSFRIEMLDRFAQISSAEFISFVKRLMHPDKEQRFRSAGEALAAFHDDRSSVRPPSNPVRRPKWFLQPVPVLAALVVAAAVLYGINGINSFSRNPSPASRTQHDSSIAANIDAAKRSTPATNPAITPSAGTTAPRKERTSTEDQSIRPLANAASRNVDSGSVSITSTPWAKVYIDSEFIGETPFDKPVTLSAGSHTVVFTHPSFEPVIKAVTVSGKTALRLDCDFLTSAGFLSCTATPWADVYIDDVYRDTTPLTKAIVLSSGKHEIRFHNPAFNDIHREVTIAAHDTLRLSVSFPL
ncbi:MAG TPA: serine/threonine-protein kinase [Bacteroidota bacterium]|nr:serine/threonine-protein kinase [Bacteroidota bacterium]